MLEDGSVPLEKELERVAELREFERLFDFGEPNDRAIAIVGAAFLDTLLEEMLTNFFVRDEKEAERLLQPDGALGSFSARISACFCLGRIGEAIKADLRLVAKIRNRFAHDIHVDFADAQIKKWCEALAWHRYTLGDPPSDATTRDLYQVGVHQLVTYLSGLVGVARLQRQPTCSHGVVLGEPVIRRIG